MDRVKILRHVIKREIKSEYQKYIRQTETDLTKSLDRVHHCLLLHKLKHSDFSD